MRRVATVSRPVSGGGALIRGGISAADTIRSGAPRSTASLADHSTARPACAEPSVPTTMGLVVMMAP
jgi:hypothetical protein